jgi:ribosomal protein S20
MRSKSRTSRVLAATVVAATLAGGGVLGATAVAGAQTGGDRPPAEADRPPDGRGPGLDAAAQALNLGVDDLRSKLEGGATLAQVAQQQGVDVQTVIDAMVKDATAHLDQAVQEGRLTADQANERTANLNDRITRLVNEGKPKGEGRGRGPGLDAAAKALGVSTDELRQQLQGGKTIAQVAQDRNVDKQKVIDAMVKDAQDHIDQAVKDGRLTADQANERKADLKDRITSLVDNGPQRGPDGEPGGPDRRQGGEHGGQQGQQGGSQTQSS